MIGLPAPWWCGSDKQKEEFKGSRGQEDKCKSGENIEEKIRTKKYLTKWGRAL
jgi:hypothetical protein